jgi:L-ascorbate metabolism protein UlaG (beta-lactamase superfamily)
MNEKFHLPPRGVLSYLYFGHVTFAVSDGEHVIVIDPFFGGQFTWKNKTEQHLDPPTIRPETVAPVNAILVSHEHGDHWDRSSMRALIREQSCRIVAPRLTLDAMKQEGIDIERFTQAAVGLRLTVGQMIVTVFPSIESEGQPEPVQRVGFLIEGHGAVLYHQGDSHGPARAWQQFQPKLDALITWPVYVDNYVMQLRPPSIIFHHMDRFAPGDFFCNRDAGREVDYWQYRYPQTKFVAPPRNRWLSVKSHQIP